MATKKLVSLRTSNARLLKLADFLEALPPKRFNYSEWIGLDWKGAPDLSCGTTACALGWATAIPAFRRLGLVAVRRPSNQWQFARMVIANPRLGVKVRDEEPILAGAVTFGITFQEAVLLFSPSSAFFVNGKVMRAPGPRAKAKAVADHIRRFVTERNREALRVA